MQWITDNDIDEIYYRRGRAILEIIAKLMLIDDETEKDRLRHSIWAKLHITSTIASPKYRTREHIYRKTFTSNAPNLPNIWTKACKMLDITAPTDFFQYNLACQQYFDWLSTLLAKNSQVFETEAKRKMMELGL